MTTDEVKQKILDYAYGCGIDPGVALAQAQTESGLNPSAYNPNDPGGGAKGLMQFTSPAWSQWGYGPFDNAFDIDYNLAAWCAYMGYLLNLFNWDYQKALAAYNGGPGHFTNPARYGPPSQAALAYGQKIAAAASYAPGAGSPGAPGAPIDSTVALNGSGASGANGGGGNGAGGLGLSAIVLIAAAGLALIIYSRD